MTDWRTRLGPLGVWAHTELMTVGEAAAFAALVDELGYGALWLPETMGRDPFTHIAHLASQTDSLVFATGIASIHHRQPGPMMQAAKTLGEQTDGRFVLGLGVSHAPMVEGVRGLTYSKPLSTMRAYLEAMDASPFMAKGPSEEQAAPRLLAALGPKMLELSASHADGAHPYLTTPEHTASARSIIGPNKLLCVEQKVVLTDDPAVAHATATAALSIYVTLPNYRNSWLRLGITEDEISTNAPSFLDRVVVWGSVDKIRDRVREHHDAGADHVCIQALTPHHPHHVDQDALRVLSPGGLGLQR